MKLVVIYGPPAAGKLAVAQGLSTLTGYHLFHNHLAIDAVRSISAFGTSLAHYFESGWPLSTRQRAQEWT